MPLPFFSTGGIFGTAYSRVRGLLLAGELGTTQTGPISPVAGIALVQPALVCSTVASGAAQQLLSTAKAAISAANFIYIPQTTGPVSVSATTAGDSAPPQFGMGAAIVWDAGNKRLMVWSSQHDWFTQTSTVGGGYFTSS